MFKKKIKGFLLIELLVALALFAILTPVFFGLLMAGQKALSLAKDKTTAVFLAREYLEEIRAGGYCHSEACGKQPVDGFDGFTREIYIEEVAVGEGILPVREIRVVVCTGAEGAEVSLITWQSRR